MEIHVLVPGDPVAKGRPRLGSGHTYTPERTRKYEELVRLSYISGTEAGERMFPDVPLEVEIVAAFHMPKKFGKAKRISAIRGEILPEGKPDLDNIAKAVLDALNGVAYRDDSRVVSLRIKKKYAECGHLTLCIRDFVTTE